MFKYSLWNARTNTEGYNLHISEWEFIIKYHGLLLLNLILPTYHGIIDIPKSPFISAYEKISRNYFSPDRRLFRLAYVSRHYRYYHITVYFGSAKISRHRYSSHIVRYLIIVAYDGSTIYHGCSAISVSEASSHRILPGKPNDPFVSSISCSLNRAILPLVSSLCWFGKRNDTLASHISTLTRWAEPYLHLVSSLVRWTKCLISS